MNEEKKKILIVEDERPLRGVLQNKIEKEGFLSIMAKNGEEGLELALSEHPDVILLDIVMPNVDGLKMLKRLREDEWGKTAKVIILSNYSYDENINEANKYDVYDYVIKSDVKIDEVVKKVRHLSQE